jgi:hypothetical protein
MAGFVEGRGDWYFETFTLAPASSMSRGTAVCISNATGRQISEYSGGQQGLLGFLKHASANSLPAGKGIVAIPRDGCTAFCDVPTGLTASSLSQFDSFGLYKPSGVCSYLTTAMTSATSHVVEVVGPCDSSVSRIEVTFIRAASQYWSASSTSIQ